MVCSWESTEEGALWLRCEELLIKCGHGEKGGLCVCVCVCVCARAHPALPIQATFAVSLSGLRIIPLAMLLPSLHALLYSTYYT